MRRMPPAQAHVLVAQATDTAGVRMASAAEDGMVRNPLAGAVLYAVVRCNALMCRWQWRHMLQLWGGHLLRLWWCRALMTGPCLWCRMCWRRCGRSVRTTPSRR